MTSTQDKIQHAAYKLEQLLRALEETDAAPSQYKQHSACITDLDTQIDSLTMGMKGLRARTTIESIGHDRYSKSTFRRFAHKATGQKEKFAEKAAKEEKEYFDALQAQKSAEDALVYAKQLRAEAEPLQDQYEKAAHRHAVVQAELDALYDSIFEGPTPAFPEEDAAETACSIEQRIVHDVNEKLERERQSIFLLRQISTKLAEARDVLDDAKDMSQLDMFGGGALASMEKRNNLEHAAANIQQVRNLQDQIKSNDPNLPYLGKIEVDVGSTFADIFFDNIGTDIEMHGQIKRSIRQVDEARARCESLLREREPIMNKLRGDAREAQERLQHARLELQQARGEAFCRVLGGGQTGVGSASAVPNDAPPPYSM